MKIIFALIFSLTGMFAHGQYACQDIKMAKGFTKSINNNAKSDSVDILEYHLNIDATAIADHEYFAKATITFKIKTDGVKSLNLDLAEMQVDNVKEVIYTPIKEIFTDLKFSYHNNNLRVKPQTQFIKDHIYTVAVYYHGTPPGDLTGWGGFHFEEPYFYNLGVGFGANPHTYGRAWFPCFDNFVEKALFSFTVYTDSTQMAYCNGDRVYLELGETNIQKWELKQPIPTYLASIAIADYTEINDTVLDKPILLVAREKDTSAIKISFKNLPEVYTSYVKAFGPYPWSKIGYVLTRQGAMEHSTSIHFPVSLVDGSLKGEDIMAHELAHHWWGNLVTCQTAEDMWINEGMAEWASHLYLEYVYSKQKYLETVQDNGAWVLENVATRDGGHLPIYGMPNELTYGAHVYQKGAMVAHNLRGYLGDSLFFSGLQQLLENNKYGTLNTQQFQVQLSALTGKDLSRFFNDWILQPGYPVFHVNYQLVSKNKVEVNVKQTQFAATHAFINIPVNLRFLGKDPLDFSFNYFNDTTFLLYLGFKPEALLLNPNSNILTGNTSNYTSLEKEATLLKRSNLKVEVKKLNKEAHFYGMYYWSGPTDALGTLERFQVNEDNYWNIQGDFEKNAKAEITLPVNLKQNSTANINEEYLVLLHRKNAFESWKEHPYYSIDYLGNNNDGRASIVVTKQLMGDFVLGNRIE